MTELNYRDTQKELKARGLSAKGGFDVIRDRLNAAIAKELTQDYTQQVDEYAPDEPALITDIEEINEYVHEIEKVEPVAVSATRNRALDLVDKCNAIFKGRAQASYREENPKMIEFRGGMRQAHDVTIFMQEKTVLALAKAYVAKTVNEARPDQVGGLYGADKTDPFQLSSRSPAEIQALQEQLKQIMGA